VLQLLSSQQNEPSQCSTKEENKYSVFQGFS
jgi:hypothetical protein